MHNKDHVWNNWKLHLRLSKYKNQIDFIQWLQQPKSYVQFNIHMWYSLKTSQGAWRSNCVIRSNASETYSLVSLHNAKCISLQYYSLCFQLKTFNGYLMVEVPATLNRTQVTQNCKLHNLICCVPSVSNVLFTTWDSCGTSHLICNKPFNGNVASHQCHLCHKGSPSPLYEYLAIKSQH